MQKRSFKAFGEVIYAKILKSQERSKVIVIYIYIYIYISQNENDMGVSDMNDFDIKATGSEIA